MNRSVFLVDDDPFFQKVLRQMLESQGFTVTVASSWLEFNSVYYSAQTPPDIVLLDINLGGSLSGDKLLAAIREGRKKTTSSHASKLVLISAIPEEELAALAKKSMADGYFPKAGIFSSLGSTFLENLKSMLQ